MSSIVPVQPHPLPVPVAASVIRDARREQELKFLTDSVGLKRALGLKLPGEELGPAVTRRLQTVYFDTPDGLLRRKKVALRMRRIRGGYLMALKWTPDNEGAVSRGEIEVMVRHPQPDLDVFGPDVRNQLMRLTKGRPLEPAFATEIRRTARTIRISGSTLEIAIDNGFVRAGEARLPLREIEIELKEGDPDDVYQLGLILLDLLPLRLGTLSKAERGVQLLTGARPPAAKATPAALMRESTVDEALAIVIRNCLSQFTANWPAFREGDAGEAVHQMRVAMRRLRAVLALFARALPQAGLGEMRQEARSIASTMGMARDWDVFASLVRSGPAAHFAGDKGLAAILRSAAERSAHGHKQVQALLDDTATSRFVLRIDAYVARHGWRNGADLALLTQPVIAFAAQCLERLDRRAIKAGKHFDRLSIEEKHELRIRLKNLRYAADFFGHLFKGQGKVRRYAACAAQMQDHLGHLNDAAMARSLVAELTGTGNTQMAFAAGAITGWYASAAEGHDSVLKQSWTRFVDAERYWRDDLPASTEPARPERSGPSALDVGR